MCCLITISFFPFLYIYLFGVCSCRFMPKCMCVGQRTTYGSQFFSSTPWVPGLELRCSGLTTNTLLAVPSCWYIHLMFGTESLTEPGSSDLTRLVNWQATEMLLSLPLQG